MPQKEGAFKKEKGAAVLRPYGETRRCELLPGS
jgi:hypothetical protein